MDPDMTQFTHDQIESLKVLNSKDFVPCTYPWIRLTEKNVAGDYTFCAWINKYIGHIDKDNTENLLTVWNSPMAIQIRHDLIEKNRTSCQNNCKVRNYMLDTFLGYDDYEYETFDSIFLENLLGVAKSITDRSSEISCKPITLALFPSNICNIRCRMCKMEKKYDGNVTPRYFEEIKSFIPYLHELFVAGGEPFSCKTTRNIIFSNEVRKCNHLYVSTITNCTLLNEDIIEQLTDIRLGRVVFSIDGITPSVYNKIRIGADFEKMLANLKRFIAYRDSGSLNVKITGSNFVIQSLNYHELESYIEFCHALNIRASASLIDGSTELSSCILEVQRQVKKAIQRAKELKMDYSLTSLEGVMQKIPAYKDELRKRAIMENLFGEKIVAKAKNLFDKHEYTKKIIKNMLTGLLYCDKIIAHLNDKN